jgi:hypothetical protein
MADLYEKVGFARRAEAGLTGQYMKNYPFSDARVKRERDQNPKFRLFLSDRTTAELTQRRDVVSTSQGDGAENSSCCFRDP